MTWMNEKNYYKNMLLEGCGSINFNKGIAKEYGFNAAILLGFLCYKYDYWIEHDGITEDGCFFVTRDDIREEIGLSKDQQIEATKVLQNAGILNVYRKGIPSKNYYKLNDSMLRSRINQPYMSKNSTTVSRETQHLDDEKVDTTNKEILIKDTKEGVTKDTTSKDNLNNSSSLSEKKENNTSYKGRSGDLGNSKSQTMVRSQVYGNYTGELGEIIVKWYDAVGVNRRITFNQIKDKVDQLRKDCKGDENMMIKQINYSYLNGYPIWYPPKNTTQKNVTNSVSVRPGEVDKSGYRNYI